MSKIGTSQNGWPVYTTTDNFVRTEVAGVKFWSATPDVAVVLDDFTLWYHENIEPITLPVKEAPGYDDWSYAVRPIRGQSTGYSNHGSATARDLNATRHPRGVKGTHTADERMKIKNRLTRYGGVLRHGEFYSGTIDGMHVEIDADRTEVNRVATRIRAERAAAEEKNTMELSDKIKLTETGAEEMSVPGYTKREVGKDSGTLSVSYLLQWGGPGLYRMLGKVDAIRAAISTVASGVASLTSTVRANDAAAKAQVENLQAEVSGLKTTLGTYQQETATKLDQVLALLQPESK